MVRTKQLLPKKREPIAVVDSHPKHIQLQVEHALRRPLPGSKVKRSPKKYGCAAGAIISRKFFRTMVKWHLAACTAGSETHFRIQESAVDGLQEASQQLLIDIFRDAAVCANHSGRVTVLAKDIKLVVKIRFRTGQIY